MNEASKALALYSIAISASLSMPSSLGRPISLLALTTSASPWPDPALTVPEVRLAVPQTKDTKETKESARNHNYNPRHAFTTAIDRCGSHVLGVCERESESIVFFKMRNGGQDCHQACRSRE
ncbi:hypothetical protein GGR57DRAFT_505890 [Xylariaceae sp. FL1272]|nr:hypothetical protein GGR57DRAFT_505890 [Xylariaceae sp. FL1272]